MNKLFALLQRVECVSDNAYLDGKLMPRGARGSVAGFGKPDGDGRQWYDVHWDDDPGVIWDMREDEIAPCPDEGPLRDVGHS